MFIPTLLGIVLVKVYTKVHQCQNSSSIYFSTTSKNNQLLLCLYFLRLHVYFVDSYFVEIYTEATIYYASASLTMSRVGIQIDPTIDSLEMTAPISAAVTIWESFYSCMHAELPTFAPWNRGDVKNYIQHNNKDKVSTIGLHFQCTLCRVRESLAALCLVYRTCGKRFTLKCVAIIFTISMLIYKCDVLTQFSTNKLWKTHKKCIEPNFSF